MTRQDRDLLLLWLVVPAAMIMWVAGFTAGNVAAISLVQQWNDRPAATPNDPGNNDERPNAPRNYGQPPSFNTGSGETSSIPAEAIDAFAIETLAPLQTQSFLEGVEYCGLIIDEGGTLKTTEIERGEEASCRTPDPGNALVVANFHTHGEHDPRYLGEVPSDVDVESDMMWGTPGYISTPGGRVWVTNPDDGSMKVLCENGCVPTDPDYDPADVAPFDNEMTYEELLDYFGS